MSRMKLFGCLVTGQTVLGSFYYKAKFNGVTKPQSTFVRPTYHLFLSVHSPLRIFTCWWWFRPDGNNLTCLPARLDMAKGSRKKASRKCKISEEYPESRCMLCTLTQPLDHVFYATSK